MPTDTLLANPLAQSILPQALSKQTKFTIATAFAAAITVSIAFYWIQLFFYKNRFLFMLKKTLPHYEDLIYNKGIIKNINADQLLTFDDLKQQEFKKENGKIVVNWDHVFKTHHIPQQLGNVKRINLDNVIQLESLDRNIFTFTNGKISIDLDKFVTENHLLQDAQKARVIDSRNLVTSVYLKELYIDLQTGLVSHFSKLGALTQNELQSGLMLKENTIVVADDCHNVFAPLYSMKKAQILPLTPWKIKLLNSEFNDFPLFFADCVIIENTPLYTSAVG